MEKEEVLIKNMVCPRCIEAVASIFSTLGKNATIELGRAHLQEKLTESEKSRLVILLSEKGFELLEDAKSALISRIKTLIIDRIHRREPEIHLNLSDFLTDKIPYDYAYLSRIFSGVEGITIEKYYSKQRIEKVKELLFYGELTLSEISDQLGFSSVAYLSSNFKKETGMTPGAFKKLGKPIRIELDKI